MSCILVSFLGRINARPTSENNNRYSPAHYKFSKDNSNLPELESSRYFGVTLASRLRVNTLRVLGTPGSMWDVLFEDHCDKADFDKNIDFITTLRHAIEVHAVTQFMLNEITIILKKQFNFTLQLQLIGYGLDEPDAEQKQIDIINTIGENLNAGDDLHLDITHSLRHLPVLGLLASFYLQTVKKVIVKGIWYGAFERGHRNDKGETIAPVVRLDSLLNFLEWTTSFSNFKKDGDYAIVADLLEEQDNAKHLKEAAFYERIADPVKSKNELDTFFKQHHVSSNPLENMFFEDFKKEVAWRENEARHHWEERLARKYLARKDFLRAILWTQEAIVTKKLATADDITLLNWINDISNSLYKPVNNIERIPELLRRKKTLEPRDLHKLRTAVSYCIQIKFKSFKKLSDYRNAVAHGSRSDDQKLPQNLSECKTLIEENLREHFPDSHKKINMALHSTSHQPMNTSV